MRVGCSHCADPFLSAGHLPHFPIRLGRIVAPEFAEVDGMLLADFLTLVKQLRGPAPLYR
jgi:hypothetical protein